MLAVIVHGGVASGTSPRALGVVREAADIAIKILRQGSALEAVVAAVRHMEDSGVLNAGNGSMGRKAPDGTFVVQMDAAVGTSTKLWGAVGAVEGIKNPIDFALALAVAGRSALLAGTDATNYAKTLGLPLRDPGLDAFALARHEEFLRQQGSIPPQMPETVGAIAVDLNGIIAAATSTGGFGDMELGRVGDVVVPGAGSWIETTGAVLVTGPGDDIIRLMSASQVGGFMKAGIRPQPACEQGVKSFEEALTPPQPIGFIALWVTGDKIEVGMGSNRPDMPWHSIVE